MENSERLLTPGEVARLFRVSPTTVSRWASQGRIGSVRTPGGHHRFRESEILSLLADMTATPPRHRLTNDVLRQPGIPGEEFEV